MDYWQSNKVRQEQTGTNCPPGGSFIAAVDLTGPNCPAYNLNCTIRNNTLSNNCLIYVFSGSENSMEDCIVDRNYSFDTRCGIYVEGAPRRLLLNGNTAENVDTPVQYMTEGVPPSVSSSNQFLWPSCRSGRPFSYLPPQQENPHLASNSRRYPAYAIIK